MARPPQKQDFGAHRIGSAVHKYLTTSAVLVSANPATITYRPITCFADDHPPGNK